MIPQDFEPDIYKMLNPDLHFMNNNELINHYLNHGQHENRLYKKNLPNDFDVNIYRKNNEDLIYLSDIQCISHFIRFGQFENRIYSKKQVSQQINDFNSKYKNLFVTMKKLGTFGRLGNQMFQYALLYVVSFKYNLPIFIPIYDENFVCLENTNDKRQTKIHNYFDKLNFNVLNFESQSYNIVENNFRYDKNYLNIDNFNTDFNSIQNLNYEGYFQSYKYFDSYYNNICELFTFKNSTSLIAMNLIKNIKKMNDLPIVGLHLRRGDLTNYNGFGPPINVKYIMNAINLLKSKINSFNILIITDNLDWANNNFDYLKDKFNIFYSNNSEDVDLCLLTLVDHLVLSNSSFSWWGAYLNKNSSKIIICKSIKNGSYFFDYIVPENQCNDLYPPEWIQLEDTLDIITENVIYSTMFKKDELLSIYKLGLIKKYLIENIDNLSYIYDYGIIISAFNRSEYLQYTLKSLENSDLTKKKIIVIIFDDCSTDHNTLLLIEYFKLKNLPIIKIFTNHLGLVKRNQSENTFLPGSCFPFSLKFGYDILFRLGCQIVMNIDSDVLVSKNWINKIDYFINNELSLKKYYILTGFSNDSTCHRVIEKKDNYKLLDGFGAVHMVINKNMFYDIVSNCIFNYLFDFKIMEECKKNNIPIIAMSPSVIQHIGFDTSIIRGFERIIHFENNGNNNHFSEKNNFYNNDNIDYNNILEDLNTKAKSIVDFAHSSDFVLNDFNTYSDPLSLFVDKIFYINLDKRDDRKEMMINQFQKYKIQNFERFPAICPELNENVTEDDWKNFLYNRILNKTFFKKYSNKIFENVSFDWLISIDAKLSNLRGLVGCKISHVEVIKIAKKNNYKNVCILEDDICFISQWNNHLKLSLQSIIENNIEFDLLYLTNNHVNPYDEINDYIVRPTFGLQASGYIVNEKIYDFMINNAFDYGNEIDTFYANLQKIKSHSIYSVCPNIINQIENYSSIENRIVNYTSLSRMHTTQKYDIVFICHSKDKDILKLSINSIKQYISHYKNVYLVSKENFLSDYNCPLNIKWIDESCFPFSKNDIEHFLPPNIPKHRLGWFYQQLLKLYSPFCINGLSKNFVIIDSDVVFNNYFSFFDENNKPIFTLGTEYHNPYFEHMKRLHPTLEKQIPSSGISHHMVFNINFLKELFNLVESYHNDIFWKIFLKQVTFVDSDISRASEYETYFNFVQKNNPDYYSLRPKKWENIDYKEYLKNNFDKNCDYIALHSHFYTDYTKYFIE